MAKSMKNGEEEEEDELMLELSIGGIFEKPNKPKRIASESVERGDRIDDVNVRRRRRLQAALRRRDWRRKREEKMKKPVDFGPFTMDNDSNGFVNRKVIRVVGDDDMNVNSTVYSDDDSRSNSSTIPEPSPVNPHDDSSVSNPHYKPETSIQLHQQASCSFLARMPAVSTTGNGPNGKTISGFLYRYMTKGEVSIVCVCHGHLFTPAGFVEHAGGVDIHIAHPLKHITIFPNAFAS